MRFRIEDLEIYFPYESIYPEQYNYMVELKRCLDAKGHCLLEMPSGTGKTVTLLSLIVSYQLAHPDTGRLIYCSRTVGEIEKALEELKLVIKYRDEQLKLENRAVPRILAMGLSSRKNMCINSSVSNLKIGNMVDGKCRSLTAPWVREEAKSNPDVELCGFYEDFDKLGADTLLPSGVYTIDDLKDLGRQKKWCPYFLARHTVNFANIIIYSYHYLLDPKISSIVSKEFGKDAIVVFDEAHNIDNVCIEALSVNIRKKTIDDSFRCLSVLGERIEQVKKNDEKRLADEYSRLLQGLAGAGGSSAMQAALSMQDLVPSAVLPSDVMAEAMPGSIRRAVHFIGYLRRFLDYVRKRLRITTTVSEIPAVFLDALRRESALEEKPLKFFTSRLSSLLRTLEVSNLEEFSSLTLICQFATLLATYGKGFRILVELPESSTSRLLDPVLQFSCLDASIAMKPVFERFSSVVITSGTLSPLDMYPKILDFQAHTSRSFDMSLTRDCFRPLIVSKGSDQINISTSYNIRNEESVIVNYGKVVLEMAQSVPDGIICFFPSYDYMQACVVKWTDKKIINQISETKLIFFETHDAKETSIALELYRRACDNGRGAVLLCVARGKVSEGIDFDHHYGRCVVMIGIPILNTESNVLKARLDYLEKLYQVNKQEFLRFDAMRVAAQCIGRVIRNKTDYGIMIFCDYRYGVKSYREKLPRWVQGRLLDEYVNHSTDTASISSRQFLRQIAQPMIAPPLGKAIWSMEDIKKQPPSQ